MVETNAYDVSAYLRLRGNFAQQMARNAATVPKFNAHMIRAGQSATLMGKRIMGTSLQTAAAYTKMGAAIAGFAGAAGIGLAVRNGLQFSRVMEDSRLQAAAMFQMFDFNATAMGQSVSESKQWAMNIDSADSAMGRLYDIAKRTPASFRQVVGVYQNAAAGLASATGDISQHMQFMERASLLGGLAGGDYQVLGSQIGRIIAGSAGAEMNIWKVMQKPILEAGQRMKVFNKEMGIGQKLTQEFNEMASETRLAVFMEAMSKVGPSVAQTFGESMAGITSTSMSAIESMTGRLAGPLYEAFREWLVLANQPGGILGGENLAQLERIMETLGEMLADSGRVVFASIENGVNYLRDNWDDVIERLRHVWSMAIQAAKIYASVAVGRIAAGGAVAAGGMAMQGIGAVGNVVGALVKMGPAAALAAPAIAGLAVVIGGLGVAMSGIGAYFIQHWEKIVQGFRDGTVNLQPLITAIELLWAKMVAMGEAILGTSDPVAGLNTVIEFAAGAVDLLSDAMLWLLEASVAAAKAISTLITSVGPLLFPLVADQFGSIEEFRDWIKSLGDNADKMAAKLQGAATAFENAGLAADGTMRLLSGWQSKQIQMAEQEEFEANRMANEIARAAGWQDPSKDFVDSAMDLFRGASEEGAVSSLRQDTAPKPRKTGVTINRMEVNNDFRDTDPDRILSAFMQPLERMANKQVQSAELLDEGD